MDTRSTPWSGIKSFYQNSGVHVQAVVDENDDDDMQTVT
jgi:hypothetical protein